MWRPGQEVYADCPGHAAVSTAGWLLGKEHHLYAPVSFGKQTGKEDLFYLTWTSGKASQGMMLWATLALQTKELNLRLQLQDLFF